MDIDYLLAGLMLSFAAAIAAYLVGFARGRLEGFRQCSLIWEGRHPVSRGRNAISPKKHVRTDDILDAEELI
ncbi:MAG: hypothetical protein R2682_01870 [Pyrinomonadaceae bacterium]